MNTRGFTLIELLVVVAIVGLMASIVNSSLQSASVAARDAKRLADIRTMRTAYELYSATVGHYPIPATTWASFDSSSYAPTDMLTPNAPDLTTAMLPYLPTPPTDPKRISDGGYLYRSNGTDYCILLWRTPENMHNFPQSMWATSRCTAVNSAGQCTGGTAAVYFAEGPTWANGC